MLAFWTRNANRVDVFPRIRASKDTVNLLSGELGSRGQLDTFALGRIKVREQLCRKYRDKHDIQRHVLAWTRTLRAAFRILGRTASRLVDFRRWYVLRYPSYRLRG